MKKINHFYLKLWSLKSLRVPKLKIIFTWVEWSIPQLHLCKMLPVFLGSQIHKCTLDKNMSYSSLEKRISWNKNSIPIAIYNFIHPCIPSEKSADSVCVWVGMCGCVDFCRIKIKIFTLNHTIKCIKWQADSRTISPHDPITQTHMVSGKKEVQRRECRVLTSINV